MNYTELVHSGKYNESELKGEDKAYIEGMRQAQALVTNQLEVMECIVNKDKSTINKMIAEVAEDVIDNIVKDLEKDICEAIVSALDEAGYSEYCLRSKKQKDTE